MRSTSAWPTGQRLTLEDYQNAARVVVPQQFPGSGPDPAVPARTSSTPVWNSTPNDKDVIQRAMDAENYLRNQPAQVGAPNNRAYTPIGFQPKITMSSRSYASSPAQMAQATIDVTSAGGLCIDDTAAHAGKFRAITALAAAVATLVSTTDKDGFGGRFAARSRASHPGRDHDLRVLHFHYLGQRQGHRLRRMKRTSSLSFSRASCCAH